MATDSGHVQRGEPVELPVEERAALRADLHELGVPDADVAVADATSRLAELFLVRSIWPGDRKYSMAAMAELVPLDLATLIEYRVACGFSMVDTEALIGTDSDLDFFRLIVGTAELFGERQTMQLLRGLGVAMGRVADAVTSSFLVNIDFPTRDASAEISTRQTMELIPALLPDLERVMSVLVRKHLVAARRYETTVDMSGGYEIQVLGVGFIDLAGSTALAERLPFAKIGPLLIDFENTATSIVTRFGGRVVKLIGDEVLFVADSAALAARIGWAVGQAIEQKPDLPQVRIGVAVGEILTRDGDVFGPPVNRAARIVKACHPGSILVTESVREHAAHDFEFGDAGEHDLPGFTTSSRLFAIEGARHAIEPTLSPKEFE